MTPHVPRVTALTMRRIQDPAAPGGGTRWTRTIAEAELLLRSVVAQVPDPGPCRFEVALHFARGAFHSTTVALTRDDAHREASLWEDALLAWAEGDRVRGEQQRAQIIERLAELARYVAHQRLVSEFVDVYEGLERDVDGERAAQRARVLASRPPAPCTGLRYRAARPLGEIAHDVRRDIMAAVRHGLLPEGLRCLVRVERFEAGPGLEVEVVEAPDLWIPDVCESCLRVAMRLAAPPEGGLLCGHTPSFGGYARAATGVLGTLLALGDTYNCDEGRVEGTTYVIDSAFVVAAGFGFGVGTRQFASLRSSEEALRQEARRRTGEAEPTRTRAVPPSAP